MAERQSGLFRYSGLDRCSRRRNQQIPLDGLHSIFLVSVDAGLCARHGFPCRSSNGGGIDAGRLAKLTRWEL